MPQKWKSAEKLGHCPLKCKRAEKLGQCPRNVKGVKSWGNAPEIEKRQMIGNEEEYAPVVRRFSFFRIRFFYLTFYGEMLMLMVE